MASPAAQPSTFRQAFRTERQAAASRPPRTPLTVRAARLLARCLPRWAAIRTFLLSVAGFGAITVAAFQIAVPLGWAIGGMSLLVLEALSGGERR
ncbi:hypothetical protein [Nonomuraea sp. 10N515B]|uniref:hypothetical protein n=1 Tax=Nonomuraea sp. 10N515B TaxID=3457422 RepID=UPI003FCDD2F0